MSGWIVAHPLVVIIPIVIVWVMVLLDIVTQAGMSTRSKWSWAVACTVLWPLILVFWLTRPVAGRTDLATERTDPHARLVSAALGHEAGRIDDAEFAAIADRLKRASPGA